MIDNFNQIKELLSFNSDDEFYFVQIIQRKKENKVGGTKNHNRFLRYHLITSQDKLMKLKDEMIQFANYFNARVCINLNKRSFEKVAFKSLKNMSDAIVEKDYPRAKNAWISACGQSGAVGIKKWIVDVDNDNKEVDEESLVWFIDHEIKPDDKEKVLHKIPSKNGYHLITNPFDAKTFSEGYPELPVHKNNPTNLYIP